VHFELIFSIRKLSVHSHVTYQSIALASIRQNITFKHIASIVSNGETNLKQWWNFGITSGNRSQVIKRLDSAKEMIYYCFDSSIFIKSIKIIFFHVKRFYKPNWNCSFSNERIVLIVLEIIFNHVVGEFVFISLNFLLKY